METLKTDVQSGSKLGPWYLKMIPVMVHQPLLCQPQNFPYIYPEIVLSKLTFGILQPILKLAYFGHLNRDLTN